MTIVFLKLVILGFSEKIFKNGFKNRIRRCKVPAFYKNL